MVEDTIDDPTRIAQLLSSELTGLETGPLADVAVIDADRSVTPSPDGAEAYGIAFDGRRVGAVSLYPEAAVLDMSVDGGRQLRVESGVAVKDAVDVVRETLSALE